MSTSRADRHELNVPMTRGLCNGLVRTHPGCATFEVAELARIHANTVASCQSSDQGTREALIHNKSKDTAQLHGLARTGRSILLRICDSGPRNGADPGTRRL